MMSTKFIVHNSLCLLTMASPDFSKETLDGSPHEISPGVWVLGDMHHPAGTKNMKVNNRTFVFKLKLKESLGGVAASKDVLMVYAPGGPRIIDGVKQLERDTGLKAVALMNNGGGHHVFLRLWYDQFPDMSIWVTPTRVPQTSNGEYLRKTYSDRWELVDNTTVPYHAYQLLKYFGEEQVDAVILDQFITYADKDSLKAQCWGSCNDAAETKTAWEFIQTMPTLMSSPSVSDDEPCFFHKASKLILTGHNYEFAYMPPGHVIPKEMEFDGWFFKYVVPTMFWKAGRYDTGVGQAVIRMRNWKIHAAQWQEIFKWDFLYSTGHHELPTICGPCSNKEIMDGDGGDKGHIQRTLEVSGEWTGEADAGSWFPYKSANAAYKIQQKEPEYVAKFGEQPVLPLGGPDYDEIGMKA